MTKIIPFPTDPVEPPCDIEPVRSIYAAPMEQRYGKKQAEGVQEMFDTIWGEKEDGGGT